MSADDKASLAVELSGIRKLLDEVKAAVEHLADEVVKLGDRMNKLESRLAITRAVNKEVDADQTARIENIERKMTMGEKAQVGGIAGVLMILAQIGWAMFQKWQEAGG